MQLSNNSIRIRHFQSSYDKIPESANRGDSSDETLNQLNKNSSFLTSIKYS